MARTQTAPSRKIHRYSPPAGRRRRTPSQGSHPRLTRKYGNRRWSGYRALRSLSQREPAERVNVVHVVVSNYEIGKLRITAEMALRFAAALDVPVQELPQTDTPPEIVQQRKPSRKVLERLDQIQSLPGRKQDAILATIDHFLGSATG
jgi:transcriptional regulator with XRE-family HTH domain